MENTITPEPPIKSTTQLIYDYIYQNRAVSQQDLTYALHLSRPTVASHLGTLEQKGLVFKNGQLDMNGVGRKAAAYSIKTDARVAIGVEIMADRIKIIAVDLYGAPIRRIVHKIKYKNQPSFYQAVSKHINQYIENEQLSSDRILGIGFAMQGLVSPDGTTVVYGEILGCTGLTTDVFAPYLNYSCHFLHDPDAAALSELWSAPDLTDAIYLSLSSHLGASMISNRNVVSGKHGHTATFEHIQADPNGRTCYCGKPGCWETVVSMNALLEGADPDVFFEKARKRGTKEERRWTDYLRDLAVLIGNLHLVRDVDYVLGGHLAPYFTEEDIRLIYEEIRAQCPFEDTDDYILVSKMPSHNITIGAALPFIQRFLNDVEA